MQNEMITLKTVIKGIDESGFDTDEDVSSIEVFAEIKSVRYKESYEAAKQGLNVTQVAVINIDDYNLGVVQSAEKKYKPNFVKYDDTLYKIVRFYKTDKLKIELTLCEVE